MEPYLQSKICGTINADDVWIGQGVTVEEDVIISGRGGPARKVFLGDFAYIGRQTRIYAPEFKLGDYSKLNAFCYAHGDKPLQIGRNCWFGGNVVLDSLGGLDIDDNVGIGAQSQIWTHIQFGDVIEGCRFKVRKYMHIKKDAWFVGHCIVSPVMVGEKSMALVGSVVTRNMEPNHVYAGVPAQDVTEKTGPQFAERTVAEKADKLKEFINEFEFNYPEYKGILMVVSDPDEMRSDHVCFDVSRRVYTKTYHAAEISFLKMYTPLLKFTPMGEGPVVVPQQED